MVVLIGHTNNQDKPETKGTGFVVLKEDRRFIVTCRHVIDEMVGTGIIAIPNCRKHVFPKSNENVLPLIKPSFHPKDGLDNSYDIVVFEIPPEQTVEIQNLKLVPYEILSELEEKEGSEVIVLGYSVSYLSRHFDINSDESLIPECSKGNVENFPLHKLNVSGFQRKLKEPQFIRTTEGNIIEKGVSGGPIWNIGRNKCIGMLIASVNAEWTSDIGQVSSVKGGVFVSAIRIRETIDNILANTGLTS